MKLTKLTARGSTHYVLLMVVLVVAAIGYIYSLTVSHASTSTPAVSVTFNNPYGTTDQQYAIVNHINDYIDKAPAGSDIYVTSLGFSVQSTAQKLINANRRGVHVKVLIDGGHVSSKQSSELMTALGSNKAAASFTASCQYGCMSDDPNSIMHAKMYLFSQSGAERNISMTGSANITNGAAKFGWNDLETVVNHPAVYKDYVKYFNDMIQDKTNPNYYWSDTIGNFGMYYYPGNKAETQNILDALSKVSCLGAASGYGSTGGRTTILVGMYLWANSDLNIAQKLRDLKTAGCDVQVMLTNRSDTVQPQVVATLVQPVTTGGNTAVYNAVAGKYYIHEKFLAISGVYDGNKKSKIVFSGSSNYTTSTVTTNNNILTSYSSDPIYDAFSQNFQLIRDHYATQITSAPITPLTATQAKNIESGNDSAINPDN